jgi:hypothetical protein
MPYKATHGTRVAVVHTDTMQIVEKAMKAFVGYWEENANDYGPFEEFEKSGKPNIRNAQTALEMLYHYVEDRRLMLTDKTFQLISVEQAFAVPLDPNDETLVYIGKIDKIFRYQSDLLLKEHKTTTLFKKDGPFQAQFVDSFSPNSQIDGYLYSVSIFYSKPKACWIDAALVHKDHHDGFKIIPIQRQPGQIETWLWEAHDWIQQIEANLEVYHEGLYGRNKWDRQPYLAAFPKNTNSCTNYGGCPYLDLCKAWSNPEREGTPLGFVVEPWVPFDELQMARRRNILGASRAIRSGDRLYDNTRISDYRACPRKYYFRHVKHYKPEEDRLPLLFGGAWHAAMDVVWMELAGRPKVMGLIPGRRTA